MAKALLVLHIGVSVGWLGALLAYLPFDVMTATSADSATLRMAYAAMDALARWTLVPLALATLGTGIWIALATPWGLFRHYWVVVSLVATSFATAILLIETRTIHALALQAADPATSDAALAALPSTLPHSLGGLAVLAFVLTLNVVKPKGMTRYGWRKKKG